MNILSKTQLNFQTIGLLLLKIKLCVKVVFNVISLKICNLLNTISLNKTSLSTKRLSDVSVTVFSIQLLEKKLYLLLIFYDRL